MGLGLLTILTKNNSTDAAGSVLFNSNRIVNSTMRLYSTDDTYFEYSKDINATHGDKITVSETLATADNIFTAAAVTFYTLPVRESLADSASTTTNRVFDVLDIAYGVAYGPDTTQSFIWAQDGKIVRKYLVNKPLQTISDYITTGTTTTTTTSA